MKKVREISRKALDITTPVVTVTQKKGKLMHKWLKLYAFCKGVPLIHESAHLRTIMRKIYYNEIDNPKVSFLGFPWCVNPDVPLLIPVSCFHIKRIKPLSAEFDSALKVLARSPEGKVLSSVWQIKLTPTYAHLTVISSYYPE